MCIRDSYWDYGDQFRRLQQRCMAGDFSWKRSAGEYLRIYRSVTGQPGPAIPKEEPETKGAAAPAALGETPAEQEAPPKKEEEPEPMSETEDSPEMAGKPDQLKLVGKPDQPKLAAKPDQPKLGAKPDQPKLCLLYTSSSGADAPWSAYSGLCTKRPFDDMPERKLRVCFAETKKSCRRRKNSR